MAHHQPISWDELGIQSARALDQRVRPIIIPLWFLFLAGLINYCKDTLSHSSSALNPQKYKELKQKNWVADTTKIQQILGFRARYNLSQGLRETIAWYQQNKWL